MHLLAAHHPQLVLADINGHMLGLLDAVRGGDGLAGAIDPNTPMIVLTSRADELDRVRVFDRGGDDVVTKPFSYPELRGRIRALLRRASQPHATLVTARLTLDRYRSNILVISLWRRVRCKIQAVIRLAGQVA